MGFPLDRGSVEDGILTCHWHHARFDLASGCTFDLWADDVPTCPVEVRGGEVWVKAELGTRSPPTPTGGKGSKSAWSTISGSPLRRRCRVNLWLASPRSRSAPGCTVRRQEPRWLGHGNDRPDRPWEPLGHSTGGRGFLALFHGVRRLAADCDGASIKRSFSTHLRKTVVSGCMKLSRKVAGSSAYGPPSLFYALDSSSALVGKMASIPLPSRAS